MLTNLKEQPKDKILGLMAMYRDDPRPTKVDLGVGVYKNAEGVTPVMRAVKAAERKIIEEQTSKAYTGLAGDPAYADAMIDMLLAGAVERDRLAAVATPGGTGAIRQAFELIKMANPKARVFVSDPTWPNHVSILGYLGMIGFYDLPLDYLDTYNQNIMGVTTSKIKTAFRKHLDPKKLLVVTVGGHGE